MHPITPTQAFTLTHLGIERWVIRNWPLQAHSHPVWVVHEEASLPVKAARLLANLLHCINLQSAHVRVLSRTAFDAWSPNGLNMPQVILALGCELNQLPGDIQTVGSFSLQHLLAHPQDKKQAYLDLMQIKHALRA